MFASKSMSATTAIILFIILIAIWGLFLAWRWYTAHQAAADVYAAKRASGELPPSMTAEAFREIYMASEGPRAGTYLFVTAVICMLTIPPLLAAFTWVWNEIWLQSGRYAPVEKGTMIHAFGLVLMTMAVMIGFLAIAMRRYHKTAPPSLKRALRMLERG